MQRHLIGTDPHRAYLETVAARHDRIAARHRADTIADLLTGLFLIIGGAAIVVSCFYDAGALAYISDAFHVALYLTAAYIVLPLSYAAAHYPVYTIVGVFCFAFFVIGLAIRQS